MGQHAPLLRPMADDGPAEWAGARWIGTLDDAPDAGPIPLLDAGDYRQARLLVRDNGLVRGFVEGPITDGCIDGTDIAERARDLPPAAPAPAATALPPTTVVIGTRDRPDQLARALASVLAIDHPDFEVVVVDNASRTEETRHVVGHLAATSPVPLRSVREPRPGLSNARNAGVRIAQGEVVAFTDDDVIVDPLWLRRLADGFARRDDVACVTGLVPSGELRNAVQAYFEQRVSWASSCTARVFSLADPPADIPLFPFRVGEFGTGANFAVRRADVVELGGFDAAFGVGSPTMGGEDIDMFVRMIVAGRSLAFEPSAITWHRHRSDVAALEHQAVCYGTGLGAWLTKVALDPSMNRLAARRAVAGLRRARELAAPAPAASDASVDPQIREALQTVGRAERRAFLAGPAAYRRARAAGLQRRPLDAGPTERPAP